MKKRAFSKQHSFEQISKSNAYVMDSVHDMKEQLREALEQIQQYKLSNELEIQKRTLLEQQNKNLNEQNQFLKQQLNYLKTQVTKVKRKYSRQSKPKSRRQQQCEKCIHMEGTICKLERQKEVIGKQRQIMKSQIKELQQKLEQLWSRDENKRLHKQLEISKKDQQKLFIENQGLKRLIDILQTKISEIQLQNLQTLNNVELLQQRIQQLKMQNTLMKGFSRKESLQKRKNGSIKVFDKADRYYVSGTHENQSIIC